MAKPFAPLTDDQIERFRAEHRVLHDLLRHAVEDVTECGKYQQMHDSPWTRRAVHRSVFASIEAITNHLKQRALLNTIGDEECFSHEEQSALRDIEYIVDDSGRVVSRNARIRTLANIQLALSAYARSVGSDFVLDKNSEGWNLLLNGIKVRDRITHPKNADAYVVTDKEAANCARLWHWFSECVVNVTRREMEVIDAVSPPTPKEG